MTTLIAGSGFNPHPGHVVTFLDKAFYDDHLRLDAQNKQQIMWEEAKREPENLENGQLLSGWRLVQYKSAIVASSWKDKYRLFNLVSLSL